MKRLEQILALASLIALILYVLGMIVPLYLSMFLALLAFYHYLFSVPLVFGADFKTGFKKEFYAERQINFANGLLVFIYGWALSVLEIGLFFKVSDYPGNKIMMLTGLTAVAILTLPVYFYTKNDKSLLKYNLGRSAMILLIGLLIYFK